MQNPLKKVNLAHYWQKAFVKWGVAVVALLIVIYGVVGFFVVPGILRDKAQAFVYEKFERTLAMSDVSFNPFTLTAEIDGMRLSEHGRDDPFVTFDHLTLNVSVQSIFRMAPVIVSVSGTKFSGVPAWMEKTAQTSGSKGSVLRLTMV